MTTYNRASLKTFFETGDVPTGSDYANLIDSNLNIVETGLQILAGPLQPTELITPRVSAATGNFTGNVTVSGVVSADRIYANNLVVSAVTLNNASFNSISGSAATLTTMTITGPIYQGVGVVSAAGTTQAAAAVLINAVNRGKGIADGSTTGFTPPANNAGRVQYLFNEGASANLWPPVGGTINGLAANAAFALAASAMVTIVHLTASAMAVK